MTLQGLWVVGTVEYAAAAKLLNPTKGPCWLMISLGIVHDCTTLKTQTGNHYLNQAV